MNRKERKTLKEEFLATNSTEELHHGLEKLKPSDAKKIVESFDDSTIYTVVNMRHCEQDYIADYIEFLWGISESAYWKHVITSLDVNVGILWSDNMSRIERMCNNNIPNEVFNAVLHFVTKCDEGNKQDLETIGCVVKAQVDKFGRIENIKQYISTLNENLREFTNKRVLDMINSDCTYSFD